MEYRIDFYNKKHDLLFSESISIDVDSDKIFLFAQEYGKCGYDNEKIDYDHIVLYFQGSSIKTCKEFRSFLKKNGCLSRKTEKDKNNQIGHIYTEPEYAPYQLDGIDNPAELQTQEMHILSISKIHDFGEKIGGSAKDRARGKTAEREKGKKVGFNRLPTVEEIEMSDQNCLCKKFKPNVSDFEELGLNKICARAFFCHYYGFYATDWSGYNKNSIKELFKVSESQKIQSDISDFVIENKRNLRELRKKYNNNNLFEVHLYEIDLIYTILGMALEKEMGYDFDWMNVVRVRNRGNKNWHYCRDSAIFCSSSESNSDQNKHKVFRLEYEAVINGDPVYRLMKNSFGDCVFCKQTNLTENKWTYRIAAEFVKKERCLDSWYDLYANYADLYIELKAQFLEKFGEEKHDEWSFKDKKGLVAQFREGEDWRKGRNAEPKDFLDTFGFRAVEFGESMPQKERWKHMNFAYDSFMDLCEILNIKKENISLGGSLGICFGSRGKGGKDAPMAHYEPVKKVINLTRKMGAGSLAHEWFHAFDNQAIEKKWEWENSEFATDATSNKSIELYSSRDTYNSFEILHNATHFESSQRLNFARCARRLDKIKGKQYWSLTIECCARGFEWYIKTKLDERKQVNEYLVQIPECEDGKGDLYPYPTDVDSSILYTAFDMLFKSVKQIDGVNGKTIR